MMFKYTFPHSDRRPMLHRLHRSQVHQIPSLHSPHRRKIPSQKIQKSTLPHRRKTCRLNAILRKKYRKESQSHQNRQTRFRNHSPLNRQQPHRSFDRSLVVGRSKRRFNPYRSWWCCQKASSRCVPNEKSKLGNLLDHKRSQRQINQNPKDNRRMPC